MEEKEFKDHLQNYRKNRNKKIISYLFLVVAPALIGTFIVIIASTETIGGGASYEIYAVVPHSSTPNLDRVDVYVSNLMFLSPNPEISWSAHYEDDFISSAPLTFKVYNYDYVNTYFEITDVSSYSGSLSGVDRNNVLRFNWFNENELQDVRVDCRLHYGFDLFWMACFMFIGIVFIALSCVSVQKIHNRTHQKDITKNKTNK